MCKTEGNKAMYTYTFPFIFHLSISVSSNQVTVFPSKADILSLYNDFQEFTMKKE